MTILLLCCLSLKIFVWIAKKLTSPCLYSRHEIMCSRVGVDLQDSRFQFIRKCYDVSQRWYLSINPCIFWPVSKSKNKKTKNKKQKFGSTLLAAGALLFFPFVLFSFWTLFMRLTLLFVESFQNTMRVIKISILFLTTVNFVSWLSISIYSWKHWSDQK